MLGFWRKFSGFMFLETFMMALRVNKQSMTKKVKFVAERVGYNISRVRWDVGTVGFWKISRDSGVNLHTHAFELSPTFLFSFPSWEHQLSLNLRISNLTYTHLYFVSRHLDGDVLMRVSVPYVWGLLVWYSLMGFGVLELGTRPRMLYF